MRSLLIQPGEHASVTQTEGGLKKHRGKSDTLRFGDGLKRAERVLFVHEMRNLSPVETESVGPGLTRRVYNLPRSAR